MFLISPVLTTRAVGTNSVVDVVANIMMSVFLHVRIIQCIPDGRCAFVLPFMFPYAFGVSH